MDLRPDSPTYGQLVCLSFDVEPGKQLAFTIPPGVAHSVGNIRGSEGARLINFPTVGYADLPPFLKGVLDEYPTLSEEDKNKIAIRFIEGRLNYYRVAATENQFGRGGIFLWKNYIPWLLRKLNIA